MPSTSHSSSCENSNSITLAETIRNNKRFFRKCASTCSMHESEELPKQTSDLKYAATVSENMHLSTSPYKTSKHFDRARIEKKLRHYRLNNQNKSFSTEAKRPQSKAKPINIPKSRKGFSFSSYEENDRISNIDKNTSSESDDDLVNINKKRVQINEPLKLENELAFSPKSNISSTIPTIRETNEVNLDFSFDEDDKDIVVVNENNDCNNKPHKQLDLDNYLDKFELNVFGNINN